MLIINPASGVVNASQKAGSSWQITQTSVGQIAKDYVLYARDDSFWAMEIDNTQGVAGFGKQTPLGINPTLVAKEGDFVRWNQIPLGTDSHKFTLQKYSWVDPGTSNLISSKDLGPLENHVFTVKAVQDSVNYKDTAFSHLAIGMQGKFVVTATGGPSVPQAPLSLANLTERTQ